MKALSSLQKFIFITPDRPYMPYEKGLDTCAYISTIISIALIFTYKVFTAVSGINLTDYMLPCVLYSHTGYYCPGCGGTRSLAFFLKGDIISSIIYHPVIVYTAIPGLWLFISHSIFRIQRFFAYHVYQKTSPAGTRNNSHNTSSRTTLHKVVRPLTIRPIYIYIGIIILLFQCIFKNLLKLIAGYSII